VDDYNDGEASTTSIIVADQFKAEAQPRWFESETKSGFLYQHLFRFSSVYMELIKVERVMLVNWTQNGLQFDPGMFFPLYLSVITKIVVAIFDDCL